MRIPSLKTVFPSFLPGVVNSYTQVFFSDNKVFAWVLLAVSFLDYRAGLAGVTAVAVTNTMAYLDWAPKVTIRKGYYGFNSLLVGLGLGVYYQPGPEFFLVLAFASILTLFLTLLAEGVIGKYGLPFLSLPFLAGTWLVSLASRQFTALEVSERGVYMINDMYLLGGKTMVEAYHWFHNIGIPEPLRLYFTSLGAILFQYHLFAGVLIAAGLIIYSRIAFLLSLTGFFSAYFYYRIVGADIHELSYSYIGFNFILTSIAVGGFFIIPSRWSFLWVILLTPLISILLTGTQAVFSLFQLSVYSLPFNLVVLIFLYALKYRERFFDKPELVAYQQLSPEKNLYSHLNHRARFGTSPLFPVILPFWGEWKVTQGHSGDHTHQGDWRHAWDFEVVNDEGLVYTGDGTSREDYLAYGKPVIAPADGTVEEIISDVEENEIGMMDLDNNWGNTIVIRHTDHLYSKLSHLKKGSVRVSRGDHVRRGQAIAACGNTGRSPVPHLHFQLQATPYIGSRTLDYPVSHFIRHASSRYELLSRTVPGNSDIVSNISRNPSLEKAFRFIPGQEFTFRVLRPGRPETTLRWEVQADPLNNVCIWCPATASKAWLRFDGDIHWFTHFEGDRTSVLFRFYLSAYKVMTGFYPRLLVTDQLPVNTFGNRITGILQDFAAPFHVFVRADYRLEYLSMEDALMQTGIRLRSEVVARLGRLQLKRLACEFKVGPGGLEQFTIHENGLQTEVRLPESR